jgi:hypothetical protein
LGGRGAKLDSTKSTARFQFTAFQENAPEQFPAGKTGVVQENALSTGALKRYRPACLGWFALPHGHGGRGHAKQTQPKGDIFSTGLNLPKTDVLSFFWRDDTHHPTCLA